MAQSNSQRDAKLGLKRPLRPFVLLHSLFAVINFGALPGLFYVVYYDQINCKKKKVLQIRCSFAFEKNRD